MVNTKRTLYNLMNSEISNWWVVLEKQDVKNYVDAGIPRDRIITLPQSNQGLCYVRNFIFNYHYQHHQQSPWYWMLDDDIGAIYTVSNQKNVQCNWADALFDAQQTAEKVNRLGIYSLEYKQFVRPGKKLKSIRINSSSCDVFVCINASLAKFLSFDCKFELKVDRDFCLQVRDLGYNIASVCKFGFATDPMGVKEGGLNDTYKQQGLERKEVELLIRKWKGLVGKKYRNKGDNARIDADISWKKT